jgi:amino acid transporter
MVNFELTRDPRFTYSINFAALIVAAAGVLEYWGPGKAIQGTIMFFVVPLFLVLFNSFGVHVCHLILEIDGADWFRFMA